METVTASSIKDGQKGVLPLFAGLLVAMLLAALDQTIFSTALPTIVGELNGVGQMLWVTTAYILASTIMLPVYGKFGDLFSRKKLLIGAISIFLIGSVVGGLAHDMPQLITGRTIQGIGGGGLMTLAFAIISARFSPKERQKYSGIMFGVFGLSSVIGPLIGGLLTDAYHIGTFSFAGNSFELTMSWRWAFWLNLPFGIVAMALAAKFLQRELPRNRRPKVDIAGIGLLAFISTALVFVSSWGGSTYAWDSPVIILLAAGAVVAVATLIVVERRAVEPFLPLSMFRYRDFNLVTVAGIALGIAMFGALGYMPTYIQMVSGYSASTSGLLMLPMMGSMLVVSVVQGQIIARDNNDRFPYRWSPPAGMAIMAVGLFLLGGMTPATSIWQMCIYLAIMGIGLGLTMQLLLAVAQNTFPVSQVSTVTGANNYFRQMGATLGVALVGTLFVSNLTQQLAVNIPGMSFDGAGGRSLVPTTVQQLPSGVRSQIILSYSESLTPVFHLMVPLVLVSAVAMLFLTGKPLRKTNDDSMPVS